MTCKRKSKKSKQTFPFIFSHSKYSYQFFFSLIILFFAGEKCNVTLIIDTKADRVIFAEVGKDLFCFLIRLLQLPIATVINQTKTNGVGCIGNVYRSFKNLNESYIQSNQTKDELLMATVSNSWFEALQLFHGNFLFIFLLYAMHPKY